MAVLGTDDPNDPNNPNGGALPTPSGNVIGSSGGFVGGGGSGQGATTTSTPVSAGNTAAPSSSGHYTNLSQYLGANQGAATTTGQGVENVLNQSANNAADFGGKYNQSASADITAGGQNLNVNQDTLSAIKSGTQNVDQNQLNTIQSGIAKVDPTVEAKIKAGAAGVDPTMLAQIAAGANASGTYNGPTPTSTYSGPTSFQSTYSGPTTVDAKYKGPDAPTAENAAYTGPAFGNWTGNTATTQAQALGAVDTASKQANAAGQGFSGLSSLLKTTYQQPQYTKGENNLDAFLVGGTADANNAVQAGAANAKQAQGKYDAINAALGNQISGEQAQAKATNQAYDDAIHSGMATSAATQTAYNDAIRKAQSDTTAQNQYASDLAAAQARAKSTQDTYNQAMTKAAQDSVAKQKQAADAAAAKAAADQAAAAKAAADQAAAAKAAAAQAATPLPTQHMGQQISQIANSSPGAKVINSALGGVPGAIGSVLQGQNPLGPSTVVGQAAAAAKPVYQAISNAVSTPSPLPSVPVPAVPSVQSIAKHKYL